MGTGGSKKSAPPDPVEQGAKTGRLTLANAKLKQVPARIWLIGERLRLLDLSGNKLTELTSQIGSLKKLQTLKLSHNLLTQLPEELYHLDDLKVLMVDHNRLHTVAAVLPRKNLRTIDVSHNAFAGQVGHPFLALPPCTVAANLSFNPIQSFNESFGWELLAFLEEIDFDSCQINEIPPAIGCLSRLTCLKLRHNQLRTLPSELFISTPVNRLHLEGNPTSISELAQVEGWEVFLKRRAERMQKGMSQGLHYEMSICGLPE